MTEQPSRQTLYRLYYAGLVLLVLATSTTPGLATRSLIPWPDLVFCITAAWLIRRPEHVPPWLLVGIFLLRDIILGLPPGLWTAIMILMGLALCLVHEWLKSQQFLLEWIVVAGLYLCALVVMQCILLIAQLPIASFDTIARSTVMTMLAYPLVSLFLYLVVRIRVSYEDVGERSSGWL